MNNKQIKLDFDRPLQIRIGTQWFDVVGPVFYDEISKRLRNKPQQFKQTIYLCLYNDGRVGYTCYKTKEAALPQMMNGCIEIREITLEWSDVA